MPPVPQVFPSAARSALGPVLLAGVLGLPAAAAGDLDLYDWMGPAPIVVHGEVLEQGGRFVELKVQGVIRGELAEGQELAVDLRPANRERGTFDRPLKLEPGQELLLLLEPAPSRRGRERSAYVLVRGIQGTREVPAEGAPALLEAVRTLARIQDRKDESLTWERMADLLEDTNPILLDTALRHHLKFRRGEVVLLPALRPLLDHPRPDLRELAARLIGEVAARHTEKGLPEASLLHAELAGRARRDSEAAVRVAATEALDKLSGEGTDELLEQIARLDPDQWVRYTAERLLYERRLGRREADGGS